MLAVPFGLAIGLSVGMLGGGGSVLAVPILVYVLGQTVSQATTISLVVVAAAAVAGGMGHVRDGRVCWRHATSFTVAAVPGVALGTLVAGAVSSRAVLVAFAFVMISAAVAIWQRTDDEPDESGWKRGDACPPLRIPRDLVAGLAVGAMTGFFGVGGGFLIVPTLAIALAFTMRTAVGTSLAIIAATSLIGLGVHLASGRTLDVGITVAMAGGCMAGALAGARLSARLPHRVLARGFATMVVAVSVYLLLSVALLGGPPSG